MTDARRIGVAGVAPMLAGRRPAVLLPLGWTDEERKRGTVALFIARLLATFMFWFAALRFLGDFRGAVALMEGHGLPQPEAIAGLTIAVQMVGSLLFVSGRYVAAGAAILAGFTLLTIPLVHHFWTMAAPAAARARLEAAEHVSVIGGLLATALLHGRRNRGLYSS